MKKNTILLFLLVLTFQLSAQDLANCDLNGDNTRWESRWNMPGAGETINALITGPDDKVWATGNYTGNWGGDHNINGLVTWDDERWLQVGGKFRCTSCGLGFRHALKMDSNGDVFVGGFFEGAENTDGTYVASSGLIKWNYTDQVWETAGDIYNENGSRGRIRTIEIDTNQNILYAGGDFEMVIDTEGDTVFVNNIAALNLNDLTWTDMNGGVKNDTVSYVDGVVYAMAMGANNTLYVGGGFAEVEEQTVYSVAKWEAAAWSSVGDGLSNTSLSNGDRNFATAFSLLYDAANDVLYAGGTFGQFSGSATNKVLRSLAYFKNDTWTLIDGIGKPFNTGSSRVNALAVNPMNGHLFVGGTFTEHVGNNSPVGNLVAEWNPTSDTWNNLNNGLKSGTVNTLVFKDNKLFAGGTFSQLEDGDFCNNFVAWDGSAWDNLGEGLNERFGDIRDISFTADGFIACGTFGEVDHLEASRIARWREATGWETIPLEIYGTSASNFADQIYALHRVGDWLYVGGFFGGVNASTITNGILAFNLTTGLVKTWGTGLEGSFARVNDIVSFQGEVYIAGRFSGVDGNPMNHLAKLNASTDTWEMIGSPNSEVLKLTNVKDSILLVGGGFVNINNNSDLKRIAVYDGSNWSALGKGIQNGRVEDAVYLENENAILLGGGFSQVVNMDGTISTSKYLAKYKNGAWNDFEELTAAANFRGVSRLLVDEENNLVYVAGQFREVEGSPINRIFRLEAVTQKVGDFGDGLDRLEDDLSSSSSKVNFMGKQNGYLVLGGTFSSAGINQARSIARYELEDYSSDIASLNLNLPDSLENCNSLILNSNVTNVSYEWSTLETTPSIEVDQTGTYQLTIETVNGCQKSDSTFVTIFPPPTISFDGITNDSILACDSILLVPTGNFVEYSWNEGVSNEVDFTATETAWVVFTGQDDKGCFGKDSVYVFIPSEDLTPMIPDSVSSCAPIVLDAGTDDYFYAWSNGATTPTIEIVQSGTYSLTVTSQTGCEKSATSTVTIFPNPEIVFTGIDQDSIVVCDSVELSLEGNYVEYSWNDGISFMPTLNVYETGAITILAQDENSCIAMDTIFVTVLQSPVVDFSYEIIEDSILFFVIDPVATINYTWDFGDGTTGSGAAITHLYAANGTYEVQVSAMNSCGNNSATMEVEVDLINSQKNIYASTSFSVYPNPTSGLVLVKWARAAQGKTKIEMLNVNGSILFSKMNPTQETHEIQLDISSFPAGIYFGRWSDENGVYGFRIVKN